MAAEPTSDELRRFYEERSKPKKRERFQIDKQGNLAEYDTKGTLMKTIVLPTYRPPTEKEVRDMETERLDNIAVANRAFEDARRSLYQALQDKDSRRSDILDLNRSVRDADILLQKARFPLRSVRTEGRIKIKDIDFNQLQETRTFPYSIAFTEVRPFTLQQQYVRIGDLPLPEVVSVEEALRVNTPPETVVLFSDRDMETSPYGFMAPGWPVTIAFKDRMYASARHAIFSELAREFKDLERADAIQSAESSSDIRYTIDDVVGGKDVNQIQWNRTLSSLIDMVNIAKFDQYSELAQRLIELPSPLVIGAYEPNDTYMGIGLSIDNIKAKDKLAWTGENLVGKALMKIRENLIAKRIQPPRKSIKLPRKAKVPTASTASATATATASASEMDVTQSLLPQPNAVPMANAAPMAAPMAVPMAAPMAAPMAVPMAAPMAVPMAAPMAVPIASLRKGPRVLPRPQAMPQAQATPQAQAMPFNDQKYNI